MSAIPYPELDERDCVSVVVPDGQRAGSGVAELWCGSALLGILYAERGGVVLRLESHARGPLAVSVLALERALAQAFNTLGGSAR